MNGDILRDSSMDIIQKAGYLKKIVNGKAVRYSMDGAILKSVLLDIAALISQDIMLLSMS